MTLKSFFLPSAEVGEQRRVSLLGEAGKGTKGKLLVTGGVLIGAGAAIAAGPTVLAVGAKKAITKGVELSVKYPKTAIATSAAGIFLAGSKEARKDVLPFTKDVVTETPAFIYGLGNVYDTYKLQGADAASQQFKELVGANKTGAIVTGGAVVAATGYLGYQVVKGVSSLLDASNVTDAFGNKVDNEKEYKDYIAKLKGTDKDVTPPPTPLPTDKTKDNFTTNPPSTYVDKNLAPSPQTSATPAPSNSSSGVAPVNIQQNNYYGDKITEKYLNSKKNTT